MDEEPIGLQAWRKLPRYTIHVAVSLGVLYFLWSQLFIHDYILWQFTRKYAAIQHPSGTQPIKFRKDLGLLIGNSNHVDFFAGELRTYTGSRRQIVNKYSGQEFTSPSSGERNRVEVLFVDDGKISYAIPFPKGSIPMSCEVGLDIPYPITELLDSVASAHGTAKYYIVYIFDAGYRVGIDIRGC